MYISTSSTFSLSLRDLLGENRSRSQVPAPWFIGTCFARWQSPCLSLSPSDPCWFSPSKGSGTTSFDRLKFKFYGEDQQSIITNKYNAKLVYFYVNIPFEYIYCDSDSTSNTENYCYHNEIDHARRKQHRQCGNFCYNTYHKCRYT